MPDGFEVELWRIVVPLPPPPKDVQTRRLLESTPLTPQERIEHERRTEAAQKERAKWPFRPGDGRSVVSGWVADPGAAEGEVTIEVRVRGGLVELDEPNPPIETLNRWAWNRIQERFGQPVALRLDQGMPVVALGDGLPIPGQRAERYGSRSAGTDSPRGAGAAFMRAVENDPEAQAALKRAQARLRASAEALKAPEIQRELERSRREQEQAFQALADAIRESVRAAQQDLGDLGFMPPKTLEDWEHLARMVEMPFETIQAGNFTAHDVYVMALAWMDRQRMLSQLKRDGDGPQSKNASERSLAGAIGYTVAALRDMTGLGNNALNRYAKTANVTTPQRGERDFKYTLADVRAILQTIIASTAEDKLRDRCKTALRNLPQIAE